MLRLGAAVSLMQSALFPVIGVAAFILGADRLVHDGFASLPGTHPVAFQVLCAAFVAIAVLGLAITPAERLVIEAASTGWAAFGAAFAYLGHAGTIGYFGWWLVVACNGTVPSAAAQMAPIEWGVTFELGFVGGWVWVITALIHRDPRWPRAFVALSVFKAISFWFALCALAAPTARMIELGVGLVTCVTGPAWHAWIARIMRQIADQECT